MILIIIHGSILDLVMTSIYINYSRVMPTIDKWEIFGFIISYI